MDDTQRKAAEQAYTLSSYWHSEQAPVGSRDWMVFWQGWQASLAAANKASALPLPEGWNWQDMADRYYEHIKHGDEEHRAWLRRETDKFFAALPAAPLLVQPEGGE